MFSSFRLSPPPGALLASCVVLAALAGCADTPPETPRSTPIAGPTPDATANQVAELTTRGCRPHVGNPVWGTIGVRSGNRIHRFDCKGVPGEQVREGVRRFLETGRIDDGLAHALGGYPIWHYLGTQRFCNRTVYTWYLGDVVVGSEVVWNEGSCVDVAYFWIEWIPGYTDDELPEASPGGGGPYYGPTSPPDRTPRVDTTKFDHHCEGLANPGVSSRRNMQCLKPISTNPIDSLRIWDSLRPHFRPLSQINATGIRERCEQLQGWFGDALAFHAANLDNWPFINRGATDSVPPGRKVHDAQTNGVGTPSAPVPFHIDPRVLDGADSPAGKRLLLESVLHELLHARHAMEHKVPPFNTEAPPPYTGFAYFWEINTQQCTI